MKTLFTLLASATLACTTLAGAARAAEVRYDYDKTVDTSNWKTWAWQEPSAPNESGISAARIRTALAREFTAKGYRQVTPLEADFRVDYYAAARPNMRVSDTWSPGFGRDLRVDKQMVGSLVVEIYDARSGRLAWQGVVSDALAKNPDQADKKTAKAVDKLLRNFPAAKQT